METEVLKLSRQEIIRALVDEDDYYRGKVGELTDEELIDCFEATFERQVVLLREE